MRLHKDEKTSEDNNKIILKQFLMFNPLTAGVVKIRFLHFMLAHYISVFKPG